MNNLSRFVPWLVVGFAAIYLLLCLITPERGPKEMDLYRFGTLPVQAGGRIKPLDTVARTTLLSLSNRQSWREANGDVRPAIEWLLDVMTVELPGKRAVDQAAIFRIDNDQLLALLKLEEKPGNFRYSIAELAPEMHAFDDKAKAAVSKDPADRDLLDRKVLDLRRSLERYLELSQWRKPAMVPPEKPGASWSSFLDAIREERDGGKKSPAVEPLGNMLLAYKAKDAEKFNKELASYHKYMEQSFPEETKVASFEAQFNHFEPFYQCSVLYLFVLIFTCVGWLIWGDVLRETAFWLAALALAVHTTALIARMYIGGRPPVTNLYSSAVFIGWATVILGLIIERMWGLSIGNFVAGVSGSVTVLIAHFLGSSGDTLEMMQAVLDTNFWLATHVTCITLGYAATYVAGILGMVLIGLGWGTRLLTRDLIKVLGSAMYGVVCFAMFLSFTGTVLGGIWADWSWGRFWGWDPKENGALLIVLINAIVLHARWGGLVQVRGMAVLCIVGNIVTTWSWFGVNMLGVGLHSYGFIEETLIAMVSVIGLFLAFIVAGTLPTRLWRSFNAEPVTPPRPRPQPQPRSRPKVHSQ